MKTITSELNIGATAPFKLVHITDTHLTYADERDDQRKIDLAQNRVRMFPRAEDVLTAACGIAKKLDAPIVHTGDLIDFVSVANLERAKRFTDEYDCFFATGNHEFSLYVGEAFEDAAYRNQSLDKVQAVFKNNIRMASRVINGVNFVALDDGYYLFEEAQLAFLKAEAKKGLPMVLLMHNPIFEQGLYDDLRYRRTALGLEEIPYVCTWLTAVPDELMKEYTPEHIRQQKADEITRKTVEYIKSEPLIKAMIAGHVHCNYEGILKEGVPLLITSTEDIRVITVK